MELQHAEMTLLRLAQVEAFLSELRALKNKKFLLKFKPAIVIRNLQDNDEAIRVDSVLTNTSMDYNTKHYHTSIQ